MNRRERRAAAAVARTNTGSVLGQIISFDNDDGDVVCMMASAAGVARVFLPKGDVANVADEAMLWMKTRGVERVQMVQQQVGVFPITEETVATLAESIREKIAESGLNLLD